MQLIPIEKVFSNRDSIRKAREAFLILKGRTIDPEGLNIREETYWLIYLYCIISYFIIFSLFYFIFISFYTVNFITFTYFRYYAKYRNHYI